MINVREKNYKRKYVRIKTKNKMKIVKYCKTYITIKN